MAVKALGHGVMPSLAGPLKMARCEGRGHLGHFEHLSEMYPLWLLLIVFP